MNEYRIESGEPEQIEEMLALFPRLADFDIPVRRSAEDLWAGDAELLRKWAAGQIEGCVVLVALTEDKVKGVAFARLRPELLSHRPSAHLEAIAVDEDHEGRGVGKKLMTEVESQCAELGAESLTLHVFRVNQRARKLYAARGFDEELIRCIKPLSRPATPHSPKL